jgi:hypothetical protein
MTDHDTNRYGTGADDARLRSLAHATFATMERSVTTDDTATALANVRARAASDTDGHHVRATTTATPRRPLAVLLAAAAVVVVLVAGLAVLLSRGGGDGAVVPATVPADPPPTAVTSVAPTTTPSAAPATTTPATSTPATSIPATIAPSTTSSSNAPVGEGATTLAIPYRCTASGACTQLSSTEDGRLVAYDPIAEVLEVWDPAGAALLGSTPLDEPLATQAPWFVHTGPDDVAYISVDTPTVDDPSNDLLAIPLSGPRAGEVVERRTGLDGSGDSTLVARADGLAVVGCCGPAESRPSPDAVVYPFVDSNGTPVGSTAPTLRLDLGEAGNTLVRVDGDRERQFALPTASLYPRDVPVMVAADDGGVVAWDYVETFSGGKLVFVRFGVDWPDFAIDNADVYVAGVEPLASGEILLERSGTVIVATGDAFVRSTFGEIASPGWGGRADVDTTTGVVAAPGLNDHIDDRQPMWASDPTTLAWQIVQSAGPNEQVQTEFDEASGQLTITTTGLLDDSVAATRLVIATETADDGLLRFVDGTWSQSCQPGRGHQDFRTEPCV